MCAACRKGCVWFAGTLFVPWHMTPHEMLLCAGPCEFEYHDDHLEWSRIKEDFDKADPRDQER